MSRTPNRPTLKLPAKPAAQSEPDPRPWSRKPVRSGVKVAKPSLAQRERLLAEAKAARLAGENRENPEKREERPRPARAQPAPRPPMRSSPQSSLPSSARARPEIERNPERNPAGNPARGPERSRSAPRSVPRDAGAAHQEKRTEDAPKKVYPKRGIARSTGARALPPARTEQPERFERLDDTPPTAPVAAPPSPPHAQPAPAERPERSRPTPARDFPRSPARPASPHVRRDAPPNQTAPHAGEAAPMRRLPQEPPRLSKRICELFQCSRREADEWIENSWVRVDGVVVNTLGTRAHPKARIEVSDEAHTHRTESVTILLNKPAGTQASPTEGDSASALQLIRPENRWEEDRTAVTFKATHLRGLALAGRLDSESTGMLVFTQEGSVARRITGDDTRLEKEYMVRVEGELSPEQLQRLNFGLSLDEVKLKRAQVAWQSENQLRFVLHESRKQQIQRMCELVGLRVTEIKRIRIGSVSLGKLPPGKWRYLRENERF